MTEEKKGFRLNWATLKLAVILFAFAAVVAVALGLVNKITSERIAAFAAEKTAAPPAATARSVSAHTSSLRRSGRTGGSPLALEPSRAITLMGRIPSDLSCVKTTSRLSASISATSRFLSAVR